MSIVQRRGWIVGSLMAIVLAMGPGLAAADVVQGSVFTLAQPNGDEIQVRIWGDEFYTVVETLDGYTLVRDPDTQVICYARVSDDRQRLLSTGVAAGTGDPAALGLTPHLRIDPKAAAAQARAMREDFARRRFEGPHAPRDRGALRGPTTGNVEGICLIVDFSDDPGTISPSDVTNYCNQVGFSLWGNNGSVRDYFHDVSDGALTYTNFVPTAYYRAQHPKSYYNDPGVSYGTRARELIIEALTDLENNGFDFSQYDADGDGIIDGLNCFYAGDRDSAWAQGLWPHAWTVSFCADGVCTYRYQITDMQDQLRLSTFVHENGHMLMGWPDLYDYDYDSRGVGQFCIMCYGTSSTNPCEPCAYLKHDAGWTTTHVLTSPQTDVSVPSTSNTVYLLPHPTLSNEFFMIENRQQTGRDVGLPDHGLAIWHIDTYGSNNWQQQTPSYHYLVTLVQADGRWDMENDVNSGDSTDLWALPYYKSWTPSTNPDTSWWDGSDSGISVTGISASATVMDFDLQLVQDCNGNGLPDYFDIATCDGSAWCGDCNGNGVPDECDLDEGRPDCNANGVPDECEDCNGDGLADDCESTSDQGLAGAYYATQDLSGWAIGRLDDRVDYDWGNGAPISGMPSDQFSVRWTGYVLTTGAAGTYTFYTTTDDGVRLWVDGQLLIDEWIDQGPTEYSGAIALEAARPYRIVMEYYENGGGAVAELRWQPPGDPKQYIPAANLRPARDCNANGTFDACDIAAGTSIDANGNGIPDECEAPPVCLGDCNCDGQIDFDDINPFVEAVTNQVYCDGTGENADLTDDDPVTVDFSDINPFVELLTTNTLPIACP